MKTTLLSLTTLFAFSAGVAFAQTEKVYVKKGETYVSENLTISEEVVSKTAEADGTYHEKDKNYSGVYMHGVFMEITGGTANLSHVDFLNNKLSLTLKTSGDYDSRITGGFAKITHSVNSQTKEIIPAKMTVSGKFKNNTSIASVGACPVYGGIFYVTGNADLDISNSIFENNISSSTYNVQGAVVAMDGGTQNITIKNSEFKGNQAIIYDVEQWTDYVDNQIQIKLKDGTYTSFELNNFILMKEGSEYTAEDIAYGILGSDAVVKTFDINEGYKTYTKN